MRQHLVVDVQVGLIMQLVVMLVIQYFAQQYQQLEKLYNRNLENKIPSAEKNKEASYNSFNNAVNAFLGQMRIVQRSMNENNEQLMSDLDDLEREAKNVLGRYNYFVD